MSVEIKRCFLWSDIKTEAVRLKNDIEREFNIPIRLRAGLPGALDVFLNGEQIYSKKRTGRLPTSDELIKLIHDRIPAA